MASYSISDVPLRFIFVWGLGGVLIDIDHPIAYYWLKIPDGRFLHPYVLILSGVILCVGIALSGRLLGKVVLRWIAKN